MGQVNFAGQRSSKVMQNNAHVQSHVAYNSAAFVSRYHPVYHQKSVFYNDHIHYYNQVLITHPVVWETWHAHGFYGPWWYGFYPVSNIEIYFYNPMVYWFYTPYWDDFYYRTWYATEYNAYPDLNRPFPFYGVWYPTDNLRQLLFGASAMSAEKQAAFRSQVQVFTQMVTQELANQVQTHVSLSKGDIALTHYEIVGYDDAVILEGAVSFQSKTYNFKGLVNLNAANKDKEHQTQVFLAASSESPPTQGQLKQLDQLNASIGQVRGEAGPAPSTSATPANTPSGEVSADPQKPKQ